MRKFTRIFLMLLAWCCIAGVQSVNAATEKVYATFENPKSASNSTWNAETKSFTWSGSWSNAIENIGLPTGDITGYEKLVVDCEIVSGEHYRVLFYATGHGTTSIQVKVTESGKVEIPLSVVTDEDYLTKCSGICLSGGQTGSGEVKVNEVYLETYDDEVVIDDTKKHATFYAPQNRNTTWDAETRTFGWTSNSYNQLMNIGLPAGDVSKYKKLVIDCTINSGEAFRILFYDSNLSANETLWVRGSGVTEFNIKDLISEDFILNCGQICLSGNNDANNATGSAVINALYLETYPEGESYDDVHLTAGMYHNWDGVGADASVTTSAPNLEVNFGQEKGQGSTIFGDGAVSHLNYTDLTGCSKMIIKGTPGIVARTLWNRQTAAGSDYVEVAYTIGADGIVEVDFESDEKLKDCAYLHLNVIKFPWNGLTGTIEYIAFGDENELVVIDGKNLTPNFKEYTSASYVRKFNTAYTYGTICLPFAPDAATCANYTFYKLAEVNSEALIFEEEAAPKANTAYLYKLNDGVDAETAKTFTGGVTTISDIVTEPVGGWQFIGSFAKTEITDLTGGDYWAYQAEYNSKKDVLVKAGTKLVAHPYRAYFKFVPTEELNFTPAAATMRMIIGGKEGGAMEIQEVIAPEQVEGAAFDLEGRPVENMQKGQIYIIGGKKVKK